MATRDKSAAPDSETENDERMTAPTLRDLSNLAGMAAIALGTVYVFGVITKAGQISNSDEAASTILPLVPLPQLLVIGIQQSLIVLGVTAVGVVFGLTVIRLVRTVRPPPRERKELSIFGWTPSRPVSIAFQVALGLLTLFLLALTPLTVLASILPMIAFGVVAAVSRRTKAIPRWAAVGLLCIGFLLSTVVLSYLGPQRPPEARVVTVRNHIVRGPLLVATGSSYIVGQGHNQLVDLPAGMVRSVHQVAVARKPEESAFSEIFGVRPFGLKALG
jgi:hypothetical protein